MPEMSCWISFPEVKQSLLLVIAICWMDWRKQRNWKQWPCWLNLVAIMFHDNVTHYTVWMTRHWFRWYEWEVLQHPPQTGHQETSIIVGLSKCLWPGGGPRVIIVLLWWLLTPCTWTLFFGSGLGTLVFCWVECLNRDNVKKQYECLCWCVLLSITRSVAVAVCTLLFQHPRICLLRVKVTVLFIFDEKVKLMSLKAIYHIVLLISEQWTNYMSSWQLILTL